MVRLKKIRVPHHPESPGKSSQSSPEKEKSKPSNSFQRDPRTGVLKTELEKKQRVSKKGVNNYTRKDLEKDWEEKYGKNSKHEREQRRLPEKEKTLIQLVREAAAAKNRQYLNFDPLAMLAEIAVSKGRVVTTTHKIRCCEVLAGFIYPRKRSIEHMDKDFEKIEVEVTVVDPAKMRGKTSVYDLDEEEDYKGDEGSLFGEIDPELDDIDLADDDDGEDTDD